MDNQLVRLAMSDCYLSLRSIILTLLLDWYEEDETGEIHVPATQVLARGWGGQIIDDVVDGQPDTMTIHYVPFINRRYSRNKAWGDTVFYAENPIRDLWDKIKQRIK